MQSSGKRSEYSLAGWAARRGPAGSSPQAGRGGPRAGRRRLRPRGGPATPQGAAGTERAGEGRGPRRSVAPRSRSKQKAPVPRAAAAAAALRSSPPRLSAHVTQAPLASSSAGLLGVVVLRSVRLHSPAADAPADYKAQDASRPLFLGPLRFRRSPQSGPSGKEAGP